MSSPFHALQIQQMWLMQQANEEPFSQIIARRENIKTAQAIETE